MEKRGVGTAAERDSAIGFSVRLSRQLHLRPSEGKSFTFESSKGVVKVTVGKSPNGTDNDRPIHIEGVLRWYGMEYEVTIDNRNGSGVLGPNDRAKLFDRTANRYIEGDMPARVYQTLLPLIELEADDLLKRARAKKH